MQAKVMAPVFVAFVVALAAVSVVTSQELVVCPVVDDESVNATILPNLYNCSTFYMCSQGVPELMECPSGLQFNRILNLLWPPRRSSSRRPSRRSTGPVDEEVPLL
ncbi:hypothetical protein MRX96_035521 [Rhipicephalus microplus]